MTVIDSVILDVPDPALARAFYTDAFGLDGQVTLRTTDGTHGTESPGIALTSDLGSFTDPDGFSWQPATVPGRPRDAMIA
jgi:catechol 2,3-dioxygenase-like lactoylglutathione lyase family enzyme